MALRWFQARPGRGEDSGLVPGFARVFSGQSPFYEVWYGKVDLGEGKAFWFRYTLSSGASRECASWAILFEEGGGRISAGKQLMPLSALEPAGRLVFSAQGNRLDGASAVGAAGELSWELGFRDLGRRFEHVPPALVALGLAKSSYSSCLMDMRWSGVIRRGGEELRFSEARGSLGHIYGKKHAHGWVWCHCNDFEGAPDVVFEGLSAQIRLGSWVSPPLSSFVLFLNARCYSFSSALKMIQARSEFGETAWRFQTSAQGATLEGEVSLDPERAVLVTYTDTDGSKLWCRNSKLSNLKLRLRDPSLGLDRTFTATRTAAFEVVSREKPAGAVTL